MESDKYHVVYEHYRIDKVTGELKRYYQDCSEESEKHPGDWSPAEYGGRTVCRVYLGRKADMDFIEHLLSCGIAEFSLKDAFDYRLGRLISHGKAMKALEREQQHG